MDTYEDFLPCVLGRRRNRRIAPALELRRRRYCVALCGRADRTNHVGSGSHFRRVHYDSEHR